MEKGAREIGGGEKAEARREKRGADMAQVKRGWQPETCNTYFCNTHLCVCEQPFHRERGEEKLTD